jgi:hypothetical protein
MAMTIGASKHGGYSRRGRALFKPLLEFAVDFEGTAR